MVPLYGQHGGGGGRGPAGKDARSSVVRGARDRVLLLNFRFLRGLL